ncbi:MAG TPA: hypothetical protein VD788_11455 [Candidatus Polarisedimenticolaceae bacterium]|nr:hypothetical protein [Candidatus Polarisedimenticolaceae bacterium]
MADNIETHKRALQVNLDRRTFGTFAEIGAGQEVARWFLQVGGAAGSVAKTISAYDMTFSDAIYGRGSRYVSRERLLSMLDHEYALLLERLAADRGTTTQFFVFADTVEARNYSGTNDCHGWLGVRFQDEPGGPPSDVRLHVNLRDPTNLQQQRALGILGVNLIFAALYRRDSAATLLDALFTDLSLERIEIDVVELAGPAVAPLDTARLGQRLVRGGLAQAVLLRNDGTLVQPSSLLRKRPLVVERGLFPTVAAFHRQMLDEACAELKRSEKPQRDPLPVPELSVLPVAGREAPDEAETHRRLHELLALGGPVLLTRFPQVYHLTSYLRRYTREPLRFVFGASTLVQVLHDAHYADLMGGVLEALGRLLADNVKIYLYPMQADVFREIVERHGGASRVAPPASQWVTAETIEFEPPIGHLFRYLREMGWVVGLDPPRAG